MAEDMAANATAILETRASNRHTRIFHWLLAIPLAAILLWWSLRGTDWQHVGSILSRSRLDLVGAVCAIGTLSNFLRALRWRVLLSAGERLGVGTVFWATMAGYLSNSLLPARAGEIIRSMLISRRSKLTKTYVLTTALTERMTDAVVLVVATRLLLWGMPQSPAWLEGASTMACALGLAAAVIVVALRFSQGALGRLLAALPVAADLRARLRGLLEQVVLGFSALDDLGRLGQFCGLTALIWLADAASSMVLARALGLHLSFPVAVLLLTALGLGSALPSTPGYVGIYQFVAVTVLAPFGFTREEAVAYILVVQATGYVVITFWGVLGFWRISHKPESQ